MAEISQDESSENKRNEALKSSKVTPQKIEVKNNRSSQGKNKKSNLNYIIIGFTSLIALLVSIVVSTTPVFKINLNNSIRAQPIKLGEFIPLEGNLKPNELLKSAKYIAHKKLTGPESIVFDKNGFIYTGLSNGQIVRVEKNGAITKIVQMGEETNGTICDVPYGIQKCGRPLGLRIDKEKSIIYVADAFYGIFKVDIVKKTKELIFSSTDQRLGEKGMKLVNDLDINGDIIYFIDSSHKRGIESSVEDYLEGVPRGRLFSYNLTNDGLRLLAEDLYYPNGLQLTPSKDGILVNENLMARIIKYHLSGEKMGQIETYIELPGFGDNMRLTNHQTLLVPFALVRHNKYSSIFDLTGSFPFNYIRSALGYFIDFMELIKVMPKYGLLVEYDLNTRRPIRSWHDPTGKIIESISQAEVYNGRLYLGSFYINYIAVVDYTIKN